MTNKVKEKLYNIVSTFPPTGDDWEYEIPVGYIPSKGDTIVCLEEDIDDVIYENPDVEFAYLYCTVGDCSSVTIDNIVDFLYEQALNYERFYKGEEMVFGDCYTTNKKQTTTNIVNLTPHAIDIVDDNGNPFVSIPASGQLARVTTQTVRTGESFNGIPVSRTTHGEVENLPDRQENTIYIVSLAVALEVPEREDVFIPNESIRNDKGQVAGCKSLGHV